MAKKQPESAKNKAAKRQKAADDKTFGLKNKNKSSKVQNFVRQVEEQTTSSSAAAKRKEAEQARRAAEKKAAEAAKAEARALFGSALQVQKVPFGVDPKTVLCSFFKQGLCNKGNKCKFSHDLEVERKKSKKDLYTDDRADTKEEDTMDKWDDEKLAKVILSKHGNPKTTTDIICKFFIEAIENSKYGWFWKCPNGETCKYRHSLPPGFKLKTKEEQRLERQAAANEPKLTLEDFIEIERKKLPTQQTKVTLESFTKWKQDREAKKQAAKVEAERKKGPLSGRQLMDSGKYIAEDDDDDWDFTNLRAETLAAELEAEKQAEEEAKAAEQAAQAAVSAY